MTSRDDPRQTVRIRRYFMAAASSVLVICLLLVWHLLGMLERGPFLLISAAIAFWMLAFYWIFRKGLNRRWADPSLTLQQMGAATLTMLGAAYMADRARAVFLVILMMVLTFGVLRLGTRALLVYAAAVVCGYAGVLGLLWMFKRHTLDLRLELVQLLVFAVTMPWFALMGGYISELREQLKTALRTARANESALAESQRLAHIGSWSFDLATGVAVWSAETYRIFGIDPDQPALVGAEFSALVHAEDREQYMRLIHNASRQAEGFDIEYRVTLPSGSVRWVHTIAKPAVDDKGHATLINGTVMDITERKCAEEQVRQLAHFDALTELPNRNLLIELLRHALSRTQRCHAPLALLFIDLDGFKKVNDTLGHEAGDFVLATFAQRLRACLRKSDTAARLGGDEFVVLVEDYDSSFNVSAIAERVLTAASTPFRFRNHEFVLSASVGVATHPWAGTSVDALIKNADLAMYSAKQAGKNSWRNWAETFPAAGGEAV